MFYFVPTSDDSASNDFSQEMKKQNVLVGNSSTRDIDLLLLLVLYFELNTLERSTKETIGIGSE